ncbi:MAG: hypothetical protein MUE96_03555 [Bacteroidia bacterium]|jgi:hypothetical protein|nr:hypothetical protein [Bacteroidia bacterium]
MQLEHIKQELGYGDQIFIAKSTGYSVETVKKVLRGERINDKILKAAEMLIDGKKSLHEQISIMAGL